MTLSQSGSPAFVSNLPGSSIAAVNAPTQSYPMHHPYVTSVSTNTMTNLPNVQSTSVVPAHATALSTGIAVPSPPPPFTAKMSANNNLTLNPTNTSKHSSNKNSNNSEPGRIAFPPPFLTGGSSSSSSLSTVEVIPSSPAPPPQISSSYAMPMTNTASFNYINVPQSDLFVPFAKTVPTLQSVMTAAQPLSNSSTVNNAPSSYTQPLPPPPPPPPILPQSSSSVLTS